MDNSLNSAMSMYKRSGMTPAFRRKVLLWMEEAKITQRETSEILRTKGVHVTRGTLSKWKRSQVSSNTELTCRVVDLEEKVRKLQALVIQGRHG